MIQALFNRSVVLLLAVIIAIGAGAFAIKSYRQNKALNAQIESLKQQSPQVSEAEVNQLVETVGKLIALPEGDKPTVATITDRDRLKDVPFFSKAENGDKVLMFVDARKAFLYRPSTQKIIEVATVNLNTAQQNQSFAPKVALRNSTDVAGLTKQFEDNVLKKALPNAEIGVRDNAKITTTIETIVIDIAGDKKDDAQRLATAIGAKVGTLPTGETAPAGSDFLVLIGRDRAAATTPTSSPTASPTPTP